MKYAMKKVRKNRLSGATAIVTPLIFLMSLATQRFNGWSFLFKIQLSKNKKNSSFELFFLCQHRPIFPGRRQPSIVGTDELNCRVRNGNGWTLIVRDTDLEQFSKQVSKIVHKILRILNVGS